MQQPGRIMSLPALLLAAAFVASACSAGAPSASVFGDGRQPGSPPVRPSLLPTPSPVTGEVPADVVARGRAAVAAAAGAEAASTAELVVASAVTWPDGSLGCPEPGLVYPQMVTPGYHLVFATGDAQYDVRASEAGEVRLCQRGGPRAP
jgi:hypothetical protein